MDQCLKNVYTFFCKTHITGIAKNGYNNINNNINKIQHIFNPCKYTKTVDLIQNNRISA